VRAQMRAIASSFAVRLAGAVFVVSCYPATATAQTVWYHLHNEASATSGFKQLKITGPDAPQAVVQTAALQGVATGEKKIVEFNTATGAPNTAGKIPANATVRAIVWMRKTANLGTMSMVPVVKVRLNTSTGTALCSVTGPALSITLTAYDLTCTTAANITMTASDRLYVWVGVNLTAGSSAGAFRGELGVEGTLNGSANSRVEIPTALPAPTISALSPNVGGVGQSVTIAGNNFRSQQLGSVVRFFNNRTAAVTS
jgi:IPT/TIG domain